MHNMKKYFRYVIQLRYMYVIDYSSEFLLHFKVHISSGKLRFNVKALT